MQLNLWPRKGGCAHRRRTCRRTGSLRGYDGSSACSTKQPMLEPAAKGPEDPCCNDKTDEQISDEGQKGQVTEDDDHHCDERIDEQAHSDDVGGKTVRLQGCHTSWHEQDPWHNNRRMPLKSGVLPGELPMPPEHKSQQQPELPTLPAWPACFGDGGTDYLAEGGGSGKDASSCAPTSEEIPRPPELPTAAAEGAIEDHELASSSTALATTSPDCMHPAVDHGKFAWPVHELANSSLALATASSDCMTKTKSSSNVLDPNCIMHTRVHAT